MAIDITSPERRGKHRNYVHLIGEIDAAPVPRTLRNGTHILTWRLNVSRSITPLGLPLDGGKIDILDCVTAVSSLLSYAALWVPGDVVSCHGALRRRFWRSPAGARSRCEVDVVAARRLRGSDDQPSS